MVVKAKNKPVDSSPDKRPRKAKFQADISPADERIMRALRNDLQLGSNTDFLSDALTLFRWAVSERKLGHRILT